MKLTDKHVSDKQLNLIIALAEIQTDTHPDVLSLLLEIKQRRAEDRYREASHANDNA